MIGTEGNLLLVILHFNKFLGEIQSLLRTTLPLNIAYQSVFQKYSLSWVISNQVFSVALYGRPWNEWTRRYLRNNGRLWELLFHNEFPVQKPSKWCELSPLTLFSRLSHASWLCLAPYERVSFKNPCRLSFLINRYHVFKRTRRRLGGCSFDTRACSRSPRPVRLAARYRDLEEAQKSHSLLPCVA